jgi:hypothetical protein
MRVPDIRIINCLKILCAITVLNINSPGRSGIQGASGMQPAWQPGKWVIKPYLKSIISAAVTGGIIYYLILFLRTHHIFFQKASGLQLFLHELIIRNILSTEGVGTNIECSAFI